MKLVSFSVTNFRSITTAHKIKMNNMTVLVGKNNEGKSNILRALSLAMDIMKIYAENSKMPYFNTRMMKYKFYNWERDFPIALQERSPNGVSSIDLLFELNEFEIQDIRNFTGIKITSNLPIRVAVGIENAKIDIPKRGSPAFSKQENKQRITEYVCNKIDFNFIPAVRTENDAIRVVESIIDRELLVLNENQEYISATSTIKRLQQSVLDDISNKIIGPLKTYLPSVRGMSFEIQKEQRRSFLRRNIEVMIDDGAKTTLQSKGDGIKSLTALAMLNISNKPNKVSVIAIEEPESHLHPEAARQLYKTIMDLSKNYQVILTTHSPLFINRLNIIENVIVDKGKATPVKKIKELREVLGTIVSDNLINAEYALIVEGEDDKIVLEKILPNMSDKIRKSIQNGRFFIDYIGGAGNLTYKLSLYRNLQCQYHILLDNDGAGVEAGEKAINQGLAEIRDITYTICNGIPEAEFEDCLNKEAYKKIISDEFGVNIEVSQFKNNKKWSERMKYCFLSQGKRWDDSIEKKVKIKVAEGLLADHNNSLCPHKRTFIDKLVQNIEDMMEGAF